MLKKILITLSIFITLGLIYGWESTYTREAEVISIKGDTIMVKDKSGHIWEYNGSATVGDSITLVMYDNHTSNIDDDIIKGIR